MTAATKHDFASIVMLFVIGFLGPLIAYLSTDDAAKYIEPAVRFWMIAGCASLISGFSAIKAFITVPKNGMGNPSTIEKPNETK